MPLQKAHSQPSSTFSNSQTPQAPSQFASRPFGIQVQNISIQRQMEDAAFAEQKMEATRLEIQAKHGTITPEGQERLTLLQAKMHELLLARCNNAAKYGNNIERIAIRRPDSSSPVQAKLTIGQPGDKYEQEADDTARQVVQRIHQQSNQQVQREVETEEEQLQTKSVDNIQRQELSVDEELQMKPMVQRVADGGMAASVDVEAGIQRARGGGQPLADSIREPMEQAFGADFGGVRIHTDATSDKLNKSIQARAFTTEQDIFFRQGEYSPGSNVGKELLAHELTHVVQQSGGVVQPKVLHSAPKENKIHTKETAESGQALQTRESSQNAEQADTTNNTDTAEVKTDTEDREKQKQTTTQKHQTPSAPPTDIGNGTTDPPPTKKDDVVANTFQNQSGKNKQAQDNQLKQVQSVNANSSTQAIASPQKSAGLPINADGATGELSQTETGDSEKSPASAKADPEFVAVVNTAKQVALEHKQHAPAHTKAVQAQAAAESPANEVPSKAQANQVEEMGQTPTPTFDTSAFKAKLMQRIADTAPKNLKEADEFKNNNQLGSVKNDLSAQVKQEKQNSQGQLEQKTKQAPDTSGIEPKQVTPLSASQPGVAPSKIGANKATPKSKGRGEVETPLQNDSKKLDQQLAKAKITEEQLTKSNEPQFQQALAAKQEAQTNAVESPQKYRQQEQGILTNAQATAEATAQNHLQGMHSIRTQTFNQVTDKQVGAKGKDEQTRAKIAGDINKIYEKTKIQVDKALSDLDAQVMQTFDAGAVEAKKAFEDYVDQRMKAYKDQRYGGITGKGQWVADQFLGLPSEVNAFYQEGRQFYIQKMDGVIDQVVSIIGKGLTQAKAEIATGKQEIQTYVNQLPQNLKAVGQEAATDIQGKFDDLEQSVNNKQDELIETLTQKYQENLQAVDARIDELKAANGGLIQKAADAVAGVVKTITDLAKMLMEVLGRVAGAVDKILQDPIGFLGNLIQALKQGFQGFMKNIAKYLQQGLIGWLTGTLAGAGIQMPENFDSKGIFSLVTQVLGFTYEIIRAQAVKRLGEKKVSHLEQSFDIFKILVSQGVGGIWQYLKDQMGDLNTLVIEPLKNFVIERVVFAGIEWVLSLLTPASAFVKAAKAIYQIISFFMERAQQIADLISTILDAIVAIASGSIGAAAKAIESALAKSLPVVISFLASLLGLGGIAGRVQAIFQKLRRPVEKAVDWIIDKGAKAFKKIGNKFNNSKAGKKFHTVKDSAKEKYKAGKQWVEDKKEAGKNWVEGKKQSVKDKFDKFDNKVRDKFGFGKDKDKESQFAEVDVPKSLVIPKPFSLQKVSSNLAQQLASTPNNVELHDGKGNPKQETKKILTEHKDAKYNKSVGQLTLPGIQQSVVENTTSLDQLGKVIASQTGVQKVLLSKKEKLIEIGVQINPYETVGTFSLENLTRGTGQKILLLGEANFSFAKSLAQNIGGQGIVATSYESGDEIKKKYQAAKGNMQTVESQGAQIFHGVDAQNIDPNIGGPPPEFQFIVFNYPFVEGDRPTASARNREMLAKFMQSASKALSKGGKIFVTSKQYWLSRFHLEASAKEAGLKWENAMDFDADKFPGYEHRETHEDKSAKGTQKGVTLTFTKSS
ncbi:Rossmann-like fold-containing protein [Anabaena azotica]|uniref:DUF2431 domain-containing protein n=1 Tax=Anabaena azotica FACHB-119 TaxID=947527 RepID=A0ABR8D1V5_9NOST|nr:Rossmann-like fold-containing protein [Anabaena azotica]MBD2501105.1 DUF2431 domain-containing protein [Anabaena azotica FACHB-119]